MNRTFVVSVCALTVAIITKNIVLTAVIISLCLYFINQLKSHLDGRRRFEISSQLSYAVGMLSNSIRAGLPLTQSLMNLTKDGPDSLRKEFQMLSTEIALGTSLESGLKNMANRLRLEDFDLLVTAINVQKQTGGNLPVILTNLETTMRERQKLAEKVKASTAQGKLTGLIIICLPPLLFIVLHFLQPGYFDPLTSSLIGQLILVLLVFMDIAGGMAISKICDVKY